MLWMGRLRRQQLVWEGERPREPLRMMVFLATGSHGSPPSLFFGSFEQAGGDWLGLACQRLELKLLFYKGNGKEIEEVRPVKIADVSGIFEDL